MGMAMTASSDQKTRWRRRAGGAGWLASLVLLGLVAVGAAGGPGAIGSGLFDQEADSRRLATLTGGRVDPDRHDAVRTLPGLVTTRGQAAELEAAGLAHFGDVDFETSFVLFATWSGCGRDRAFLNQRGTQIRVEVEPNVDCATEDLRSNRVVLDWSVTGDTFSYREFVVRDRMVERVEHLLPVVQLSGREGQAEPGPDRAEVWLAATPSERVALAEHPAYPSADQAVLEDIDDPLLMVLTTACVRLFALGLASGEARILLVDQPWAGCEGFTSSTIFALDHRFPRELTAVGINDFLGPADVPIRS